MKELSVSVQPDHLERMARGRKPVLALAELIWNALDADARHVDVAFDRDITGGLVAISVRDDGTGISEADAEAGFGNLGGSWKRLNRLTRRDRRTLHGKEGKGRFFAFALGTELTWTSRFAENSVIKQIVVETWWEKLGKFRVSDVVSSEAPDTGTEVRVTGVPESAVVLASDSAFDELAEVFALYLRQYPQVSLVIHGRRLDPAALELRDEEYTLPPLDIDGRSVDDLRMTVVEWRSPTTRSLYFCDPEGFALHTLPTGIQAPGFHFTAYLKSKYVRELYESNALLVGELHPGVSALHEAARLQLRDHFRRRSAEQASELVNAWKREDIYPYEGEPTSLLERTERQVFEVVALSVNSYLPEFATSDRKNKAFSFRLLKQAIESNPDSMQRILIDVLGLPKNRQDELAGLLEKTSLNSIIAAAKLVADRLDFLRALEVMIYERESKKELLERSQLHRLLADHTWVFGEEFHLSADDESLTEVLKKHLKLLGRTELAKERIRVVKRADGSEGIVDLMLSRVIPQTKPDEREHLVVELKRPSKKIDKQVTTQITDYAVAVANDERFRDTKTRWVFWAVSNELDDYARVATRQSHRPRGMLLQNDSPQITVWARPWSEIIGEARARLEFFRKQLDYSADRESALANLRKTHEKYFPTALRPTAPAA